MTKPAFMGTLDNMILESQKVCKCIGQSHVQTGGRLQQSLMIARIVMVETPELVGEILGSKGLSTLMNIKSMEILIW